MKTAGAILWVFLWIRVSGAVGESNLADTLTAVKPLPSGKPVEKSPMGAVLRSALVPGWGQMYAGQPIRAAVAFCGVAGLAGTIVYQNQMVVRSRTQAERDFYLNYRSQAVWWCFGVYLLNLLDAFVDAHLWHFDTDPSLAFLPFSGSVAGCRLAFTFPLERGYP